MQLDIESQTIAVVPIHCRFLLKYVMFLQKPNLKKNN